MKYNNIKRFKESYGIACCRYNTKTGQSEVLMIKKKYTYAFFDFVFAKYKKNDFNRIKKLLNQMSFQEKIDILELNFNKLWIRIRIIIPNIKKSNEWNIYINKKNRFEHNFIYPDQGKKIKKLIHGTESIDSIWEIPKGRPIEGEKPINTAIREFKEETDISIDNYTFILNINPIVESYIVNKCKYKHTYFIAVINDFKWNPTINFSSYEQIVEIENLKWISLHISHSLNLKQISPYLDKTYLIKKIFIEFKKNVKKQ